MASLPPKPAEASPGGKDDRRYPPDDRDRRPTRSMAPQSRYRGERPYDNDRVYVPRGSRPGPVADSYIGHGYDGRREDGMRRRDSRERDRDRDRDRGRDRDRPIWERDRDYRDRGPRFGHFNDYDRSRRGFDRDSYPPHDRFRESHRRDSSYRRPSISPRRRQLSPYTNPSRTSPRPRSRSPPPKRVKLGNHSIGTSPRSRSRSRSRSHSRSRSIAQSARREYNSPVRKQPRLPERSRTPSHRSPPHSPPKHKPVDTTPTPDISASHPNPTPPPPLSSSSSSPEKAQEINGPSKNDTAATSATPSQSQLPPPIPESTQRSTADSLVVPPPELSTEPKKDEEKDGEKAPENDVKMRDRSPSPPKHPRLWNSQPRTTTSTLPYRKMSRSPPRGPRNHPRGNAPPTAPASFHPTEPRGMRRQYQPSTVPSAPSPASQPSPVVAPVDEVQAPLPDPKPQAVLPAIPAYTPRPSLTPDLDAEIARLRAHRAHLATEYAQISKGTRRALHELDMAAIDLRAAESRRRVADSQMEKARNGVLGVDAVSIDLPVV